MLGVLQSHVPARQLGYWAGQVVVARLFARAKPKSYRALGKLPEQLSVLRRRGCHAAAIFAALHENERSFSWVLVCR
jgi:hypothetical protein